MEKFGKSQSVKRVEDVRFITGEGRYVADIVPENALRAYFVRSPVSHGRLVSVNLDDVRDMDGVRLAMSAADLEAAGVRLDMNAILVKNKDGKRATKTLRPLMATDRVRHVGEAIAFIVADTFEQARDAGEMVDFEIEELPPHIDLREGGSAIHEEVPDNVAYDWEMGDAEAVEQAIAKAAHVIHTSVPDNRIIVNSMEPRGAYAEPEGDRIHLCVNGQGVWSARDDVARHLKLAKEDVRVTTPDVGGGFGMKAMVYCEPIIAAFAARTLGQAVAWIPDRSESMLSDNAGRDLVTESTLAFDENFKITAYKTRTLSNLGAYNSQNGQVIQSELFSKVAPGTYDFSAIHLEAKGIYTNTTPVDAYRGAGRPEAIFVLERSMDAAARELAINPWDLRRRNFIKPSQFPYTSATGMPYDVGDFDKLLTEAEKQTEGYDQRRRASEAKGCLRGMGLAYYIESILGEPTETAKVEFLWDGSVNIYVGTQSNGQGHETVYAQFLSDHTGIPAEDITVVQGDSDRIETGGGTGGSRSVTVQNTATLATVETIITAFSAYLQEKEGGEVTFDDERFRIENSNLSPSMQDVARMAREDGREDLLSHSATITLENRSFPNGCHVAEVEVDPETGQLRVDRYVVVDDFGNLINPMLAEGQVHGGVAQGLGQAVMEQTVFDEEGQLLSGSFMDYAMPRATDMPWVKFTSVPVPSKYNPMGMKGCGEAGTVGALAAVTNAVIDAIGTEIAMPLTPHRVWRALQEKGVAAR